MLIERQKRASRVRFRHPIRVVTLGGEPRVIRTLTANVSHDGLFFRMPEPLPMGTRVALSLEAGGRALALAQAEVVWANDAEFLGCGVRFTEFMHPRAQELVSYLVENLDTGKPLVLAKSPSRLRKVLPWVALAAGLALIAGAGAFAFAAVAEEETNEDDGVAEVAPIVAAPPSTPVVVKSAPVAALRAEVKAASEHVVADVAPVAEPEVEVVKETAAPPAAAVVAVEVKPVEVKPVEVAKAAPPVEVKPVEVAKVTPPVEVKPVEMAKMKPPAAAVESPAPPSVARVETPLPNPLPDGARGNVVLPSGAAARLSWSLKGDALRLSPEGSVTRAFLLANPARAVFDLDGRSPDRSHQLAAKVPHAKGVRLGKLGKGTRIVVDLDEAPRSSSQEGTALVLVF